MPWFEDFQFSHIHDLTPNDLKLKSRIKYTQMISLMIIILKIEILERKSLIHSMNIEMAKIVRWLNVNKLSLNLSKTHFILFRRPKSKPIINANLVINNTVINMVEKTKFLGIIIDQKLTFQHHVNYIKIMRSDKFAWGRDLLFSQP